MKKAVIVILILCIALALGVIGFIAGVHQGAFGHVPSDKELRDIDNQTASLVYSEDGHLIGKFFTQNRTNTAYEDLPAHLINALVATEDTRFFEHSGVDYRSLFRVFFKSLLLGDDRAGGGSTLSQQLAKNLYGRNYKGFLSMPVHKVKEAIVADRLEEIYSKDELLTLYFNTVPFGENVYGVEAAASRFFNAEAKNLKAEEAALLVGMLKANTYYNPRINPSHALSRRNVVLGQMKKYDYLSDALSDSLQTLPINLNYLKIATQSPALYFLTQVEKEAEAILKSINEKRDNPYHLRSDGLRIHTTLNQDLQLMALASFESHLNKMQPELRRIYRSGSNAQTVTNLAKEQLIKAGIDPEKDEKRMRSTFNWESLVSDSITALDSAIHSLTQLHAGMVAMEPNSGAVRCWVGGIDHQFYPYDQVTARRQVASAFKPILYAAALEGGVEPCSYLSNEPAVYEDYDDWEPKNYDHSSGGKYSLPGALAKSVNIPAVNLLDEFDRQELLDLWSEMEFSTELPGEPSVALGTASASVLELCMAYSVFANGGMDVSPYTISSITTENGEEIYTHPNVAHQQIIDARTAALMQYMMQKVVLNGTATALHSTYEIKTSIAGKTGTSQDYADAWFGAYTPTLTVVARVGAALPAIHFDSGRQGSGSALALPLVGQTLAAMQRNSDLSNRYFIAFPPLSPELQSRVDCEDYRETTAFENFWDRLSGRKSQDKTRRNESDTQEEIRPQENKKEKGGLLQRLFRKRN